MDGERRGAEASDTVVTLESLRQYPSPYEGAKAQLAKLGLEVVKGGSAG